MSDVLMKIFNMSMAASWIVLVILILRVILKGTPKWLNCILWGIAGVRLVLPVSFVSDLSLLPSAETVSEPLYYRGPYIESGIVTFDNYINEAIKWKYLKNQWILFETFDEIKTKLTIIWLIGVIALLAYAFISYVYLKCMIRTAVLLRDNIYQCENVISPFVLGIRRPKIYLSFYMNEQDMEHVIAHEWTHIKRKDHWWKCLAYILLIINWFNPILWAGYELFCKDIELACDEDVIKNLNREQRADYSQALLTCSVNENRITACPLAFNEDDVKSRVKSVLNYKKPSAKASFLGIGICLLVAACFLTNPPANPTKKISEKELYVISGEVHLNLPEKYKLLSGGTDVSDRQIEIQFEEMNLFEVRHTIKKICMESEKIRPILEKYNIRGRDIKKMFRLYESGVF